MPQLGQALCRGGQVEPLDGPAGSILECLFLPSGELVLELAAPIFYLLGALTGEQSWGTGRDDECHIGHSRAISAAHISP